MMTAHGSNELEKSRQSIAPKGRVNGCRRWLAQYASEPDYDWYRLRREWPSIYESHANLARNAWTKIRIEVRGRVARLFVNGSAKPVLVVDGLKGEDLHGAVGLWGYTNAETYFSNVRITPAIAQGVENGSEAAGSWHMLCSTDAGQFEGSVELQRNGSQLGGRWLDAGENGHAISGTWRNGYVEFSFPSEWPKEARQGTPGPDSGGLRRLDRRGFRQRADKNRRTRGRNVGCDTDETSAVFSLNCRLRHEA